MDATKLCRGCGEAKPLAAFARCRSKPDGLQGRCKSCRAKYVAALAAENSEYMRRYYREHRDHLIAEAHRRRKENPEPEKIANARWARENRERANANKGRWLNANPEKRRAAQSAYHARNRESIAVKNAKWAKQNPAAARAKAARYRRRHPEKVARNDMARRARKIRAPGRGFSRQQWTDLVESSLGLCVYCNERRPLTADHIDPLMRGGSHDPENIVAACKRCNSSKNDTPLIIWLAKRRAA